VFHIKLILLYVLMFHVLRIRDVPDCNRYSDTCVVVIPSGSRVGGSLEQATSALCRSLFHSSSYFLFATS